MDTMYTVFEHEIIVQNDVINESKIYFNNI